MKLVSHTRRKCFISNHHNDESEVSRFIQIFDHDRDVLIARGIGARMSGDIIDSVNEDYIKSRIREKYLRDTTVTIVLVGKCTWARRFVDWEVAASLRNTATARRSGLLAITLPSVANSPDKRLPDRVEDNVYGQYGYARWRPYPATTEDLANMIEAAYDARIELDHLVDNSRPLRLRNGSC